MASVFHGVTAGMAVYSADGIQVGQVVACSRSTFEVEKGFFPKYHLISYDDVSVVEDNEVFLTRTKDQLEQAWRRAEFAGEEAPPAAKDTGQGASPNATLETVRSARPGERLNTGARADEHEPVTAHRR